MLKGKGYLNWQLVVKMDKAILIWLVKGKS